jgi:hypothetical protein
MPHVTAGVTVSRVRVELPTYRCGFSTRTASHDPDSPRSVTASGPSANGHARVNLRSRRLPGGAPRHDPHAAALCEEQACRELRPRGRGGPSGGARGLVRLRRRARAGSRGGRAGARPCRARGRSPGACARVRRAGRGRSPARRRGSRRLWPARRARARFRGGAGRRRFAPSPIARAFACPRRNAARSGRRRGSRPGSALGLRPRSRGGRPACAPGSSAAP